MVADALRRAHLHDGVPWSSMAVLVRSVIGQVPLLRRALAAAGVPVGDRRRRAAAGGRARGPPAAPAAALRAAPGDARRGGGDRAARRAARRHRRAWACAGSAGRCGRRRRDAGEDGPPQPLAAVLRDPRELTLIRAPAADRRPRGWPICWRWRGRPPQRRQRARRAVGRVGRVRPGLRVAGGAAAGGARGAAADRDLDAVCALFDAAARFVVRLPPGLGLAVPGQPVRPGDPGRHPRRARPRTAMPSGSSPRTGPRAWSGTWSWWRGSRRASGRTCGCAASLLGMDELVDAAAGVLVPGTGTDAWPRRAGGQAARRGAPAVLRRGHPRPPPACRHRVGSEDSEERPSRFLAELAGDEIEIEHVAGAAPRWLSLPALTADLRRAAADPDRPPRAAPGRRRPAGPAGRGRGPRRPPGAVVPLTELSDPGPIPAAADGLLVRLSPSQVESFTPVRAALAARGRRGRRVART